MKHKFLLLFLSTALSLLLAEALLQALKPKAGSFNHHRLYCEHDTLLGWRKVPGHKGLHRNIEYEVLESINSAGIRGPEYPLHKDSGEWRTIVLGDSFAEGYTVGFDSLFSEVMKRRLREARPGQRLEVINFGTGGYSTDQALLCFERDARPYAPDATVLMFSENDVWFNAQPRYYERGFKPLFVPDGDSLRLTNVPVPTLAERSLYSKTKDWLLTHSQLVSRLRNLRDNLRYAADGQTVPDEWHIYCKETSPDMEAAWQVTARLLARLQRSTAAAGSSLTVFYIPEKEEIYPANWQSFLSEYSLDAGSFDPNIPRQRLADICAKLNIPLLDPQPDFLERAKSGPPLYFQHDWHWNPEGNQAAGEILAKYFLQR